MKEAIRMFLRLYSKNSILCIEEDEGFNCLSNF